MSKNASYADRIKKASAILGGLNEHMTKLAQWGVNPEMVARITDLYDQAIQVERRRNSHKAMAKEDTAELEQVMAQLDSYCTIIKRLVRFQLPEELWVAFGFWKGDSAGKEEKEEEEKEEIEPGAPA